jgi:signal transduction histidine kinase
MKWPAIVPIAIVVVSGALDAKPPDATPAVKPLPAQRRVLVVYSTRRDTQFAAVGDREMPRLLERELGEKVDFYSEHVDAVRFPDERYKAAFTHYLKLKYRGLRFDLLIATHNLALDLLASCRDTLFHQTPLVFLSDDRGIARPPNSAGVVAEPDYRRTLDLAMALQPDTRRVFVVAGSSSRDTAIARVSSAQLAAMTTVGVTYLTGLTTEELERRVATLPEHSILYYLLFYQDAAGVNVNPLEYLDRIAAIANRPTYSWVDSTMGRGVVGGAMIGIESQIVAVSSLAASVLRGASPDAMPLQAPMLMTNQVDWRQLQRWSIPIERVPVTTLVLFRTPAAWDRYRTYVLGVGGVLTAQTALIAVLLVQRRRLRRAEERVRRSQTELRASYDRIRDLGGRLLTAQDVERSHIARELHDDVSQQVALLSIDLQMLSGFDAPQEEDARRLVEEAMQRVQAIARSVHDLSHRLHPAKLRLMGLVSAIGSLQRDFSQSGPAITFTHEHVPTPLPIDLTLALFRVAQEALRNAVDHSRATQVSIHLRGERHGLVMTIADDGAGFDVNAEWGRGLGLISMQERLDPVGGRLTIQSTPGRGTRLDIVVPAVAADVARTVAV